MSKTILYANIFVYVKTRILETYKVPKSEYHNSMFVLVKLSFALELKYKQVMNMVGDLKKTKKTWKT